MDAARTGYRPDIDGLRAIAVLSVLLCHFDLGLPGGYVGVDVFFVISGYLITRILLKELQQGNFSLRGFWERRIRRLLPALAVVTAAAAVAGWFILLPDAYRRFGESLTALTLLVSNVYFWTTTGYFQPAAEQVPLLHTWSLAVEEQFYLAFPLFLLCLARTKRLRHTTGILVLTLAVSFGLCLYGTYVRPTTFTFYLPFTRAWELLAGALVALAPLRKQLPGKWIGETVSLAGIGLIAVPCALYHERTPFPGVAAMPPVLGAALLIWSGGSTGRLPLVNRLLSSPPVVFIGLISYSLYLWHWPILVFAKYASAFPLDAATRMSLSLLSVAAGALSWRYVERPFRDRTALPSRRAVCRAGAAVATVSLAVGVALLATNGAVLRVTPEVRRLAAFSQVDPQYTHELELKDVPRRLPLLGEALQAPEVLVWGDSHAMAVLPAIEAMCRETGQVALVATHSATPPVLRYAGRFPFGLNAEAPAFNAAILEHARSERIRTVLLVANWATYLHDPEFSPALLETLDELRGSRIRVFVMKEVPEFRFDPPRALAVQTMLRRPTKGLVLSRADYNSDNAAFDALAAEIASRGATILDPLPVLPTRDGSADLVPSDAGGSYYRDNHHLSTYGALAIKSIFAPVFGRRSPDRSATHSAPATGGSRFDRGFPRRQAVDDRVTRSSSPVHRDPT